MKVFYHISEIKASMFGKINKFDMGIALAHIYTENKETFEFFKTENPKEIKGYYYIGSIKI